MHYRSVLYILGNLLLLLGAALLLPLVTALLIHDNIPLERYEVLAFGGAIAAAAIIGLTMRSLFDTDLSKLAHREGAAIVTFSWILFSAIGALPYVITGAAGFTDAYFETMSGFTTTGATIFTNVEVLPSGLQLWRHQTQWMGGMGIVVLSVAVLPMLGAGGYRLFKAEAPGGSTFERNMPRIKDTAKVLWMLYLGMSIVESVLLWIGGMTVYESICHAFTTMSTGGFSTKAASVAAWPSPFIQWVIIGFMFLAGVNFDMFQLLIAGPREEILKNVEFRVYITIALLIGGLSFVILWQANAVQGGVEATARGAFFSAVSISTTTGYGTEDFDKWPNILRLTLFLLMFMGGCTGSTAGGMKVARMLIYVKSALAELRRTVNPKAITLVRVGDRTVDRAVVSNIQAFILMWLTVMTVATIILTALGVDLLSAITGTVACLGNIGPGLGSVGPTQNFAHVPLLGKWVLVFCQLLGRLEIYSVLVLVLKRSWVR
ncbi:MAG: potassium transporter [Proteobacteria bacterium]|nr:MAG: potassium transporter [Pseudomonadota bacterium]PIE18727.1 MAG: potassium transporter [Pseudomonadota bacterium]